MVPRLANLVAMFGQFLRRRAFFFSNVKASPWEFPLYNGGGPISLKPEILCRGFLAFDVHLCASMIL